MHQGRTQTLAVGLGLFSIALGLTEIVAPRLIRRAADLRCSDNMVRLCGVREVVTGVGILVSWKRAPWLWARVAGDAIDIAATRRPAALVALASVTAVDAAAAAQLSKEESRQPARRFDYSDRSGFPRPVEQMRGVARARKERPGGAPPFEATVRV